MFHQTYQQAVDAASNASPPNGNSGMCLPFITPNTLVHNHSDGSRSFHYCGDLSLGDDIALIKLKKPVPLNYTVNIACLPEPGDVVEPGTQCVSVGWGHMTFEAETIATKLQHVELTIISAQNCTYNYLSLKTLKTPFGMLIPERIICAGHPQGGRDSCNHDSGGPLLCQRSGQWYVIGVISFGYECALPGLPGVHTSVADYIPWIENVLNSNH
ncbi:Scavenger receptor class A serine protease [Paragonimus heterotremus]|uniref:Scavenger receptor class A serine protease n=1 Tax=Paragonimus heterotremus TaxID=100268 RepID=A0A8J4TFF5_9TREM|nr:Scavenger receptor class A serine protease [Paragonimus heterotremus]